MATDSWKDQYEKQRKQRSAQQPQTTSAAKTTASEKPKRAAAPKPPLTTWQGLRRLIVIIIAVITGIQVVLWAILCLATHHIIAPWWLWTLAGAVILLALTQAVVTSKQRTKGKDNN